MIPVRLQLQNFLSYGERVPPLDFTGLRLAVLSGDNGNGKTALLDAITWSLFGKTRASLEYNIIRLGASEAQVIFDFMVDGISYRVHRQRGRRNGAMWEFQMRLSDGTFQSLTGANARETQTKIESVLRMNYQTFLTTGYLAQGKADEFARSTAADRKKALADILDLSRYERLEALAKERQKEADAREIDAEREIRQIDATLEREDEWKTRREQAEEKRNEFLTLIESKRLEYERVYALAESQERVRESVETTQARIQEVMSENREAMRQREEILERIRRAETITARRDIIEDAYNRFHSLGEQLKPLRRQYEEALELQRNASDLERIISAARDTIDRERYRLSCLVEQYDKEAEDIGQFEAEQEKLEAQISEYGDLAARQKESENQLATAQEAMSSLREQYAARKNQQEALGKRRDALLNSASAVCDYCGQPLSPSKREIAIQETEAEIQELTSQADSLRRQATRAKEEQNRREQELRTLHEEMRYVSSLMTQMRQAEQNRFRLLERARELPGLQKKWRELERRIAEKDYAPTETEKLLRVSQKLEKSERVQQQIQSIQREIDRFQDADREKMALEQADEILKIEPSRLEELNGAITRRETGIEKARLQVARNLEIIARLPELLQQRDELAIGIRTADADRATLEREIGQCDSQLAYCAKQREERIKRLAERQESVLEKERYRELAAAFGKNGVQKLIISNALPEIQNEANKLLGRMSAGGMMVELKLQREAKTKNANPIETLDILISDEMGARPYEMFSGGEAFRINLALRVALSRMLAHRAGAPLQTLILDEGFGTQDPRGREAISDSLTAIADDFALVLVITHVEELKDAFPTRIEVTKNAEGSRFFVV